MSEGSGWEGHYVMKIVGAVFTVSGKALFLTF